MQSRRLEIRLRVLAILLALAWFAALYVALYGREVIPFSNWVAGVCLFLAHIGGAVVAVRLARCVEERHYRPTSRFGWALGTIIAPFLALPILAVREAEEVLVKVVVPAIVAAVVIAGAVTAWASIATGIAKRQTRCGDVHPGADLRGCSYQDRDFSGQDLHGVDMSRANLHGANLSNADLTEANLSGADLSSANLANARLDGADLSGAYLYEAMGLTNDMLNAVVDWRGLVLESRDSIIGALQGACKGEAYPEANVYDGSEQRFHPLVLLDRNGRRNEWTDSLPWWPARASLGELVACSGKETKVHDGNCSYDDGSTIKVYRYVMDIRLVSVRTGQTVQTLRVRGPVDACPAIKTQGSGRLTGDPISYAGKEAIEEALRPYVNPNGTIERLTLSESAQ